MQYLFVLLKGMAMGAADVVPGVSGGTIAFITGIYDKLLESINSINFGLIKILKKEGVLAAWKKINGTFLVALFAGIIISILSLAKVLEHLLETQPVLLWAFFFGLILASIIYVGKQLEKIGIKEMIGMLFGAAAIVGITMLPSAGNAENTGYIFLCGMIAICAMILPGISGSFILLILGAYPTILSAVSNLSENIMLILVFVAGCGIGLLAFSRILKWVLNNYRSLTLSILIGFLIGSLYKLWPWRHVEEIFVKHLGEANEQAVTLKDIPVLPSNYDLFNREGEVITGYSTADPQLLYAILCMLGGFSIIFIIEGIAKSFEKNAK